MPGGAPGRCANAHTIGCGERRAGDAKSKYSGVLTGEMAARTIPLYVYLFLTGRTRRGFPFFVLARPSERRKSCRETPVLRRAATAICAGRPRRDAGKDTTDCTGMLTSGASAGGQEKADTRGQNGVQFEHLQYARRSSTGERPWLRGATMTTHHARKRRPVTKAELHGGAGANPAAAPKLKISGAVTGGKSCPRGMSGFL